MGRDAQTARSLEREARLSQAMTELVPKVERGTHKVDPKHFTQLRL